MDGILRTSPSPHARRGRCGILRTSPSPWRWYFKDVTQSVALEARLQEFVHGLMVQQHGKVSLEDLIGQQRFPDKLPDPGVTYKRVLQDYDPDPPFRAQRQRDHSGIRRTDYLLW